MATTDTGRVGVGTAAQRPAGGAAGDMWMATDTCVLSVYTGSVWIGINGPLAMLEAAAPSGVAGQDILYADSTAHRLAMKNNNGAATNVLGASDITVAQKSGSGGGTYSTTSAGYTDIDGTNLAHTVTVPVGWKAYLHFIGFGNVAVSSGAHGFCIADGTTLIPGSEMQATADGTNKTISMQCVFTGDGSSHTFKARFKNDGTHAVAFVNSASCFPTMTTLLLPSN